MIWLKMNVSWKKKVKQRTAEVVKQKEELEHQSSTINELYVQVTDSIKYAKRIQDAILPPSKMIDRLLPNSFILFKPKDIVSGDFYWMEEKGDKVFFAAVDCTGHGVPGALMSIVGSNALNLALSNKKVANPGDVLNELNNAISTSLHKVDDSSAKDGMDIAVCAINKEKNELEYSGAYNPLYLVRNGEVEQIKADKYAIGSVDVEEHTYTNHTLQLQKGDYIYIFSDGYPDQFGGVKGKKFMYKKFRELLLEVSSQPIDKQKELLDTTIEDWRGPLEQVDDILIIGLQIN